MFGKKKCLWRVRDKQQCRTLHRNNINTVSVYSIKKSGYKNLICSKRGPLAPNSVRNTEFKSFEIDPENVKSINDYGITVVKR